MRRNLRKYCVHALRIAIFVSIIVLIRLQHWKLLSEVPNVERPDLADVVALYPNVSTLHVEENGRCSVLDASGVLLGYVLQTSPSCDDIIGFSGPTTVLVGLSSADVVDKIAVARSGDTRDHVRQVTEDRRFMTSLEGKTIEEAKTLDYDVVSGATLTSLAIRESIARRLGATTKASLRFPHPPTLECVQKVLPLANQVESVPGTSLLRVVEESGSQIGSLLRTSPAADGTIGFQGPTDALIAFDMDNKIVGIAVGDSFDNEPYVGYVRDDSYFLSTFNTMNIDSLAAFNLTENQIEGVSGATMTSMAVADGVVLAAQQFKNELETARRHDETESTSFWSRWTIHDWGTLVCVMTGCTVALTHLRSRRRIRVAWNLVLVGYLGLTAGSLLSQAMLVGWAGHGLPTKSGYAMICLAAAAFFIPIVSKRNIYCSHLCPHGAAQQLLKNRLPWRFRMPRRSKLFLQLLPGLLLLWCLLVCMMNLSFSLVDIEPFDAYVWNIAGWATVLVAIVGLAASMFVPMAYCRFGCPTGALLDFLRFHGTADKWTKRDWTACVLLVCALYGYFVG